MKSQLLKVSKQVMHSRRPAPSMASDRSPTRRFAGMSILQLADTLDFSKPVFYYHVKNKANLLQQIALETLELAHERIEVIAHSKGSPSERMEVVVRAYVELMTERPALFAVYFRREVASGPA